MTFKKSSIKSTNYEIEQFIFEIDNDNTIFISLFYSWSENGKFCLHLSLLCEIKKGFIISWVRIVCKEYLDRWTLSHSKKTCHVRRTFLNAMCVNIFRYYEYSPAINQMSAWDIYLGIPLFYLLSTFLCHSSDLVMFWRNKRVTYLSFYLIYIPSLLSCACFIQFQIIFRNIDTNIIIIISL